MVLSAFEANEFLAFVNPLKVSFIMYMPRNRPEQLQLFSLDSVNVDQRLVQQINVYAGSGYFSECEEVEAYLKFIGYCPGPRKELQQKFFDEELIEKNGYVCKKNREKVFETQNDLSEFEEDPGDVIMKLVEIRNYGLVSKYSHHLDILLRGKRPNLS